MPRVNLLKLEDSRKSLVATSLAHFINDGLTAMLPLMYPVFVLYGVSLFTVSILVSLQSVFSILVSPWVGAKSDLSGNYAGLLALGLGLLALGAIGYAVSVQFTTGFGLVLLLAPFTVLIGVGSSFYHPLGATVLRAKWKTKSLGNAMGINGSAGSVGRVVLPVATTIMLGILALPFVGIIGALSLVGAFVVLLLMRGMKFREARPMKTDVQGRTSFLPDRELATRLFPLTVVSFSRGLFTGVLPLVPLYLQQVDGFDKFEAGLLFSLSLGIGIVSQLLFGYLQTRLGAKKALAISNIGGVATLFLFTLSSVPTVVVAALVVFGLFSYSAFPLLLGAVQDLTDLGEMTRGGAIVWGIGNSSGSAVAPLLVGALALSYSGSPTAGFVASAAIGILSIVLMPFVKRADSLRHPPMQLEARANMLEAIPTPHDPKVGSEQEGIRGLGNRP
jgi:FSR family fosmidomycin resistance protein-like MFS transporter